MAARHGDVNMFEIFERSESDKSSVDSCMAMDSDDDSLTMDRDPLSEEEEGNGTENLNDKSKVNMVKEKLMSTVKRKGRKAQWQNRHIDDLVNIVCNNENYKKRLIFMNTKNAKTGEIYEKILTELRGIYAKDGHGGSFPFTAQQVRNKFKKCVADCKKIAMTIKTATGIKRIQEERQYGAWFNELFALVKTRDSCQPDKAVEPSAAARKREASTDMGDDTSSLPSQAGASTSGEAEPDKSLFVPIKKTSKKAKREDPSVSAALDIMKRVVEHDSTKDLIAFFKDENDRAREHELKLVQMFMSAGQHQQPPTGHYSTPFSSSSPAFSQPVQQPRQFHYYNDSSAPASGAQASHQFPVHPEHRRNAPCTQSHAPSPFPVSQPVQQPREFHYNSDSSAQGTQGSHQFPVHPEHRRSAPCTQSRPPSQAAKNTQKERQTKLPTDGTPTYHQL